MKAGRGKALVAMSGGVDSSVAAALLVRAGYDVVGCFMRLGSPGESLETLIPGEEACDADEARIGKQGCCSVGDAHDARLVAAELGIPFYVCNFKRDFDRIIDYFADEYLAGRTPNPCVRCNDWLKFGKLHEYARQIGADFVASGHYAQVRATDEGPHLLRGVDEAKDQSYVLFGAPRARLREMLLPVGAHPKAQVRAMAEEFGLPVFDKPDSQEICFVPDNDYAGLVERRRPQARREGAIVDAEGRVVGAHGGQHRFTIGQRRGVGVALGRPVYVVDKDPAANTVTIGDRADLRVDRLEANETNWLLSERELDGLRAGRRALVQVRAHGAPAAAFIRAAPEADRMEVALDEPLHGAAPGQAAVCYDEAEPGRVLGGGWITSASRADHPQG